MHITSANLQMFFIPAKKYKKNLSFGRIFLCADTKNIKKMPFFFCLWNILTIFHKTSGLILS